MSFQDSQRAVAEAAGWDYCEEHQAIRCKDISHKPEPPTHWYWCAANEQRDCNCGGF